ncbi:MAG: adenylate/guanylate cyclase domain-containing protein [Geminicoccaceae bacterium]
MARERTVDGRTVQVRGYHDAVRTGRPGRFSLHWKQARSAMFSKRTTLAGSGFRARLQRLSNREHRPSVDEHEFTLMFTDIAGFTRLAESLPAVAVARLLSSHFLTLARCIEHERGRINKVMGDGLVAFWPHGTGSNTPSAPALRAALRIRAAVASDNAVRVGRGEPPIQLRVGLHAGPLVETRLDTTGRLGIALCGDTVNVAQRLEDAARDVSEEGAVTILASSAIVARAGAEFCFERLGELPMRGRTEPVLAYQVVKRPMETDQLEKSIVREPRDCQSRGRYRRGWRGRQVGG